MRVDTLVAMSSIDLRDKTILVTGATDGLGRALAGEFAAAGATVLIHGRHPDRIRDTEDEIGGHTSSERIRSYRADFSSLAEVGAMADQILSTFTLAEALAGTGVTATCLHPATYMPTKMVASPISTLQEGVDATLRLAVDPALGGVTGAYFNGTRETKADPQAYDTDARRRLAGLSDELVASQLADREV